MLLERIQRLPWRTVLITFPIVVWTLDNVGSLYRVNGSSMEPTLQHGDIVFVRKCDWGIVPKALYWKIVSSVSLSSVLFRSTTSTSSSSSSWWWWPSSMNSIKEEDISCSSSSSSRSCSGNNELHSSTSSSSSSKIVDVSTDTTTKEEEKEIEDDEEDRLCFIRYEETIHYNAYNQQFFFFSKPPIVLSGHTIVFKHPNSSFVQPEICIKRVVGVGGQWIQVPQQSQQVQQKRSTGYDNNSNNSNNNNDNNNNYNYDPKTQENRNGHYDPYNYMRQRWKSLPPHTFYVEGDNVNNTCPSLKEPFSKNLLIGIVEYILWPPERQQSLHRKPPINQQTGERRARWI